MLSAEVTSETSRPVVDTQLDKGVKDVLVQVSKLFS